MREAGEKYGEAEDEKRRKRNEKAIAERRDAGPIRVAGDEEIEREDGGEERNTDCGFAAGEEQ